MPRPNPRGRNTEVDFKGTKRPNGAHAAITDLRARLCRKSPGTGAMLCCPGGGGSENGPGDRFPDDGLDRAEALRKWLLSSWPEPDVLLRDVVRLGPNSLRESPKARAALGILEKHGWLVPLDPGTVVRGAARAEAWRIVKGAGHVV